MARKKNLNLRRARKKMARLQKRAEERGVVGLEAPTPPAPDPESPDVDALARLALEVWRLNRRARGGGTPEAVVSGLDRLGERLTDLGLECRDLTGQAFEENMVVRVIEHRGADAARRRIAECLSPAVYYRARLLRPAEVTTMEWSEA